MSDIDENLRHEKMQAEIVELQQRVNESIQRVSESAAKTAKINAENRWYPAIVGATVTLAIVAIVKIFM